MADVQIKMHKLLKLIKPYHGSTDATEFILRLERKLHLSNITKQWILEYFEWVVVDHAAQWYESIAFSYDSRINVDDADEIWNDLKAEFLEFFDDKAQKATYKALNKQIRYFWGQDPQEYVTTKLQALRYIDKSMSDERKIEKLTKGLPETLQLNICTSNIQTIPQFLTVLRKITECIIKHNPHLLHKKHKTNSDHMHAYKDDFNFAEANTRRKSHSNNFHYELPYEDEYNYNFSTNSNAQYNEPQPNFYETHNNSQQYNELPMHFNDNSRYDNQYEQRRKRNSNRFNPYHNAQKPSRFSRDNFNPPYAHETNYQEISVVENQPNTYNFQSLEMPNEQIRPKYLKNNSNNKIWMNEPQLRIFTSSYKAQKVQQNNEPSENS